MVANILIDNLLFVGFGTSMVLVLFWYMLVLFWYGLRIALVLFWYVLRWCCYGVAMVLVCFDMVLVFVGICWYGFWYCVGIV